VPIGNWKVIFQPVASQPTLSNAHETFLYILPCKRVRYANPLQDVFILHAGFAKNKTPRFAIFATHGVLKSTLFRKM
jgi:hypothetical protein